MLKSSVWNIENDALDIIEQILKFEELIYLFSYILSETNKNLVQTCNIVSCRMHGK